MLNFRRIKLEDKEVIDSFLKHQNYRASDLCFANLFSWGAKFNTQFAVIDGWLFIRFSDNNGRNSYLMPLGSGNIKDGIEMIMEDHKQFDTVFQVRGLTNDMIQEIELAMPKVFDFKLNRSVSDYIYTTEKLIGLKGKKLQSKRNHINRFKRENDWKYISLHGEDEYVKECKSLLKSWIKVNGEDEDPSEEFDNQAANLMLDNFEYLGLEGGIICVDGNIAAFTIGEKLTEDTFVVHIEKARYDIHGAYTIINQQFVENELSDYTYVNREEDMGIENLRKAKQSYYPDILLEKSVARLKTQ